MWARDQSARNRAGFARPSQKQAPLPFSNDIVKHRTLYVHLNNLRAITLRVGFAFHSTLAQSWHFRSRAQPHALDSADRTGAGFLGTGPTVHFRPDDSLPQTMAPVTGRAGEPRHSGMEQSPRTWSLPARIPSTRASAGSASPGVRIGRAREGMTPVLGDTLPFLSGRGFIIQALCAPSPVFV